MSEQTATLYDRIGGEETLSHLVDEFYKHVQADTLLSPFFVNTDMAKLKRMQHEFFCAALDGPIQYSGIALSDAHQGRGIKLKHFARFVELMLKTLEECDLSDRDIHQVISRINTYTDEVLGGAGLDG